MVRQQVRKEGKITGKNPERKKVTIGKTSLTRRNTNTSKHIEISQKGQLQRKGYNQRNWS